MCVTVCVTVCVRVSVCQYVANACACACRVLDSVNVIDLYQYAVSQSLDLGLTAAINITQHGTAVVAHTGGHTVTHIDDTLTYTLGTDTHTSLTHTEQPPSRTRCGVTLTLHTHTHTHTPH